MSNVDINVDRRTDRLTDGQKIGRLYRTLLQAGAIKMCWNTKKKSSWLVLQVTHPSKDLWYCEQWILWLQARTEWNGYFEAALSIQVRVGCTFLTSVGLRGVGIVTELSRFLYFYFRFQSGGWIVPIEIRRSVFDWLITVPTYRNIFNWLLCLLVNFNSKNGPTHHFCLFVRHKLKMIVFGHAFFIFMDTLHSDISDCLECWGAT